MAQKSYLAVVRPAESKLDKVDALLLADLQEGGHTIENDLAEIIRGGKTDYSSNATSEEIKLTVGNVPGDPGIDAMKKAAKTGGQVRVWLYERNKRKDNKYHGIFGYSVPESFEMSFDDEDNKIGLTLKIKWNTAEGTEDTLPPEWFEAAGAPTVEYEHFGEKVGTFEEMQNATASSSTLEV
ncbi:phage tail protein [Staphylococcus ratti]|uniref:Phage tail protein n=1 Tax=Staphylococcus ratti TaxID=2892440 RepID=A0ABY3PBK2_9STAP|nr:phage tail protein [Staphylococcus ratti]UEX89688.1 phage tail protein [Staphylococcus ratti]